MALADFDAYVTAKSSALKPVISLGSLTATANFHRSYHLASPFAGATPSTATACSDTTAGHKLNNPQILTFSGVTKYISGALVSGQYVASSNSGIMIIDRLSHQGGLSGTVTTAQTTNLPTAALTRYTSGVGVFIALEIFSQVGTTATTVTVSYTNQASTAGRTTKAVVFGATSNREAGAFIILPLQDGDTGVVSVESVTVLATTGTAGNFGVVLFKPLLYLGGFLISANPDGRYFDALLGGGGLMEEYKSGACIGFVTVQGSSTSPVISGYLEIINT